MNGCSISVPLGFLLWPLRLPIRAIAWAWHRGRTRRLRKLKRPSDPIPSVPAFVGRHDVLQELGETIAGRATRVIGIIGLPGSGKSALAAELANRIDVATLRHPFWLNCRAQPTADEAIFRLARFLNPATTADELSRESPDRRVGRVMQGLADEPKLVVLDNLEALFEVGRPEGAEFRERAWTELLTQFARGNHSSVVLLTSQVSPTCVPPSPTEYVRWDLQPMPPEDGRESLRAQDLEGGDAELELVAEAMGGNPLRLVQIAAIAARMRLDARGVLERPDLARPEIGHLLTTQREEVAGTAADRLLEGMAGFRRPVSFGALRYALAHDGEPAGWIATWKAIRRLRKARLVDYEPATRTYSLHPELQRFLLADDEARVDAHRRAAAYWLSLKVPAGMAARDLEDVRPLIETHFHLLEAGEWQVAAAATTGPRFGQNGAEGLADFLSRRGFSGLRLEIATALARRASRDADPVGWAGAQNSLGNAYSVLPVGNKGGNLQKAIAAYGLASIVFTREALPADWAMIQINLGKVYVDLPTGDRGENLRRAISAFEAALTVFTTDVFPVMWATATNNLGTALGQLPFGDREANLRRAIAAFEAALTVRTREVFPADWAMTQTNLGNAYANLPAGDRGENLRQAIAAYEEALTVYTREAFPWDWATVTGNLGSALSDLPAGNREGNLQQAIAAFEAALTVRTREAFPADWALTQTNLGNALSKLPGGDRGEYQLQAIERYDAALTVLTREAFPARWARTQNNLGAAYMNLPAGDREVNLKKAIAAFEAGLTVDMPEALAEHWAATQNNLGGAYVERREGDREANFRQAIAAFEAALTVFTPDSFPRENAIVEQGLGSARDELQGLGG